MRKIALSIITLLFVTFTYAQDNKIALDAKIPQDTGVRIGKLENGLTYYIRKNSKPEDKVELRLVVNAGSVLEEDDQLGLAHFMEHMAFNGTKNFEKNELISYLQSVGVKFGMHLNAYTSFDETVYILPIPSDSNQVLEQGLQILEDWAHNVSLTEEDIDAERGVVLEERRMSRGAQQRMRDEYLPIVLKDSRYANRLPIGTRQVIEGFEYETLKRFYETWYRPDLMAVVAVGDIDVDDMEKRIKKQFSKIEKTKSPQSRPTYEIPAHEETLVSIVTDKEAPYTQLQIYYKKDKVDTANTVKEYRQSLMRQLYSTMINQRLKELQQIAEPPFMFGATYYGGMISRSKDAYQSIAVVNETGALTGLKALIVENERVKRFGFLPIELERARQEILANYEKSYKEKDKTESKVYANEYVRNFLEKEPIPGISQEYEYAKLFVPAIGLEEVNGLAQKWITDDNRVVVITAPEKENVTLPEEEEVKALFAMIENMDLEPYTEELTATTLMENKPEPTAIESEKTMEKLGVTEITLANGLKVVLKPTDFKNDEILMRAFSPGGTSIYPDDVYLSADYAASIINESGVKDFSVTDLQKLLSGKKVSVSPYISSTREGFRGSSIPKDLESMLQLVHLYFTAPRKDQESFSSFINKNKGIYQNLMSNPNYYFSDKVSRILSSNHPRGGGFPSAEDWEEIDLDKSFQIYNERFADASDFIFFFVGNFEVETLKPMLAAYLGTLPNMERNESWKDLGIRPPEGMVSEKVIKGTDPQSRVTMVFHKKAEYSPDNAYLINSLADVLNIKLVEVLREEKSGVYSVGGNGSASKYPYEHYTFSIGFPCAPENVEDLSNTALELLKDIQKNGPSEEDVQKVKETQRRIRIENMKKNSFWVSALEQYYYYDRDPESMLGYEEKVDNLTAEAIKEVAQKYVDTDEFIKIVLYPEGYLED